jgi:hypothetical protein
LLHLLCIVLGKYLILNKYQILENKFENLMELSTFRY